MKSLKIILYALIFILLSGFFLQEPAQAVTIGPAGNLGGEKRPAILLHGSVAFLAQVTETLTTFNFLPA